MYIPTKKNFLVILMFTGVIGFSQNASIHVEQDETIPQLLELKMQMSQNNAFGERYKIQVFYGNNSEANEIIKKFRENFPDWPATIEYQAPNYKVWVGDFRSLLEADCAFLEIKNEYSSAFIFKPNG